MVAEQRDRLSYSPLVLLEKGCEGISPSGPLWMCWPLTPNPSEGLTMLSGSQDLVPHGVVKFAACY